jgi:glycoprotein endo-alpha-1,2-mannosidase
MDFARTPTVSGTWAAWNYPGHNPDQKNAEGRRNIASVYYPKIGVYDVTDPAYVDYQMQLLKMTGIDGISFWLPDLSDWRVRALKRFATAMASYGLEGFVRDGKLPIQDWDAALDILKAAQFKLEGRPVFSVFSLNTPTLDEVRRWKASHPKSAMPFVLRWNHNPKPDWQGVIDGAYGWNGDDLGRCKRSGYSAYCDLSQGKSLYDQDVMVARDLLKKGIIDFYADGVSPGLDDSAVNGWGQGKHVIERGSNGELYKYRWQQAINNQFPMVMIPTWDDWGEGSLIQPTVEFGNLYLELTRKYAAQYKGLSEPTGNLMIPEWIYKIRKSKPDQNVLTNMDTASQLIRQGRYDAAEKLVQPIANRLKIDQVRYWDTP